MASPSSASVDLASASRRVQVNVSSPSPAAAFSASSQGSRGTSPRLHTPCNNEIDINHVVTGVPAGTTRPRLQPLTSATAPELVVAQGLHDTLVQRLTEDLQRVAFLVSVGVTPMKARARKYCSCERPPPLKAFKTGLRLTPWTDSRGRSTRYRDGLRFLAPRHATINRASVFILYLKGP